VQPGRFLLFALLIAALAAVNSYARLGSEFVTEWDEALYATTAAEILQSNEWIGTTLRGELDYFNAKPPLNAWLIAASMKAAGPTIAAMRFPAATAAFLSVVLLLAWARRAFDPAIALVAGLVLATMYGFFYVHSGRTANTDVLLAFLVLAAVAAGWLALQRPFALVLIGLIFAAAFLLKGAAAALIVLVTAITMAVKPRPRLSPAIVACTLAAAAAPVAVFMWLRWRIDGTAFLRELFVTDIIDRSTTGLQGHNEGLFFYFDVLQRYQYEWVVAAVLSAAIGVRAFYGRGAFRVSTWPGAAKVVSGAFTAIFILITLVQTKTAWYAVPLLPLFAVIVSLAIVNAYRATTGAPRAAVAALCVIAAVGAETRFAWHSFKVRDLALSEQGLLLEHQDALRGHGVYQRTASYADEFVAAHLIGAHEHHAADVTAFLGSSQPGDFWVGHEPVQHPAIQEIARRGDAILYRRGF
jgi:4-amino-4-deoxy-L-arabinose transferase-like glycosyltransferase